MEEIEVGDLTLFKLTIPNGQKFVNPYTDGTIILADTIKYIISTGYSELDKFFELETEQISSNNDYRYFSATKYVNNNLRIKLTDTWIKINNNGVKTQIQIDAFAYGIIQQTIAEYNCAPFNGEIYIEDMEKYTIICHQSIDFRAKVFVYRIISKTAKFNIKIKSTSFNACFNPEVFERTIISIRNNLEKINIRYISVITMIDKTEQEIVTDNPGNSDDYYCLYYGNVMTTRRKMESLHVNLNKIFTTSSLGDIPTIPIQPVKRAN